MTRERREAVLGQYEKLAELPLERIQRMYEGWQEDKEACGCSSAATDLIDVIFTIALYEAKKRALA